MVKGCDGHHPEPVYRDAVGRWRAFAAHLAPVLPRLTPFVRAFGYADDATG